MTTPPPGSGITLYGRSACPPCKRTRKLLEDAQVVFTYVDVDTDPDTLDGLTTLDWVTALPVVVTPTHHWCGYRPDEIKRLITSVNA